MSGEVVGQSTDYSASTDYIYLSVIKQVWKGFLSSVDYRHPFLVFSELIWSQRSLSIDKPFIKMVSLDGKTHKRGSFMGEPLSFMTLTLINLVINEISEYYFRVEKPLWSGIDHYINCSDPIAICGDDFGSIRRSLGRISIFNTVATQIGMKLSRGKDFQSGRVLIFCEDHILVIRDQNKGLVRFEYVDVVKSRLFTTMCRQHSENRSSVLGKGRMLGNQLDYFPSENQRINFSATYFSMLDRAYSGAISTSRLPIYLPPSCGGLGIPSVAGVLPNWIGSYIDHILSIINEEDFIQRYINVMELRNLNSRNKHGIEASKEALEVLRTELTKVTFNKVKDFDVLIDNNVYSENEVFNYLVKQGIEIPNDPYTGRRDRDGLDNEAQMLGLIPLQELLSKVERCLNFDSFLSGGKVREQRTYAKWVKASNKYWGRRKVRPGPSKMTDTPTLGDLEKKVTRAFSGYIFIAEESSTIFRLGPNLTTNFVRHKSDKTRVVLSGNQPHWNVSADSNDPNRKQYASTFA
jgi:hypothetical protein